MDTRILLLSSIFLPILSWAADSVYCPQKSAYVTVGMSQEQVIAACGQPLTKQPSDQPVVQKVPMQQLIYNNAGNKTPAFWALPEGLGVKNVGYSQMYDGNIQAGGARLQINLINNKVDSVSLNGAGTNAFSICDGANIQVGDPIAKIYNSCGSPSIVNNTYINIPVKSSTKPEVWVYQPGQYQPPVSLTFVDGKLQSIN